MKRISLALGSLALAVMLGVSLIGGGVGAQDAATPEAGKSTTTDTQTTETKESAKDAYLAALAANLGITAEELEAAIDATNTELDVDGHFSLGGGSSRDGGSGPSNDSHRPSGGNNGGRGGNENGRGGNHGGSSVLRGVDMTDAATFLGISEDELRTELDGSTFLAVALARGKTNDDVRAFLIQQATEQIDERLQAAADAAASAEAADEPAAESTTISEATEVPAAPALTPTATT